MIPAELAANIAGTVVTPADSGWDRARIYHSGIGEPALVVRVADVADVQAAVRYAAAEGLPVLVRGGGHSAWGTIDGGMTIDLAALRRVTVIGDRVSVGGGAVWGQVAAELTGHGLGLSSGDTASVGVGGLTLGGGIGWMVRAWGLALDQLVGAQVVTATGEVVEASAVENDDLFWALRGGGGNFGVVTRFDFRAHALPAVVFTTLTGGEPGAVLRALRDLLVDAPRDLTVTYMDVPPMDPSAPPGASVTACWIGDDLDAANAALAPLRRVPGVTEIDGAVRSYPDILLDMPSYDPDDPPPSFVGGNALIAELTDATIDRLVAFRASREAAVLLLRSLGGAFADVPPEATAFAARTATWFVMAGAFRIPGLLDADGEALAVAEWAAIESAGSGSYGNFTDSVDPAWVGKMYPSETAARLRELKSAWDPQNLFSRNHNIVPG